MLFRNTNEYLKINYSGCMTILTIDIARKKNICKLFNILIDVEYNPGFLFSLDRKKIVNLI